MLIPLWISIKIATTSTLIVVIIGTLISWLLARKNFKGKLIFDLIIHLPLVLPPTVVGYFLLVFLGNRGIGSVGFNLLFTWEAAVIAAVISSLPLFVRTVRAGLETIDRDIEEAAALDATKLQVLVNITLPISMKHLLAGIILAFTRAIGEFGATLMIAGNLPGKTQTMSLAIYDNVMSGKFTQANHMALLITFVSFLLLWIAQRWSDHYRF
jgi:molybdate transport system permease protein